MACVNVTPPNCVPPVPNCPDAFGCPPNACPHFVIKRHDTAPPFKVEVFDEDGDPLDTTGLVLEASMWAKGKLKTALTAGSTSLSLADNIGFQQILVGDVIIMERVRSPEHMTVTGFDEENYLVLVERGANGTAASAWKKGTPLKVMRFQNAPAATELVTDDVLNLDGTTTEDELIHSYLVYEWTANDTCVPGCFWLEFKLLTMGADLPSTVPSCYSGDGVSQVRRFPACGEYLIKICDSPTAE